jgi:hypothetical protein
VFSLSPGGTLKIADGVKLAFTDKTSGMIKLYTPSLLPATTNVVLNTPFGGGDFLGAEVAASGGARVIGG